MQSGIFKKNVMKIKTQSILLALLFCMSTTYAQENDMSYRRSSWYNILISHPEQGFSSDILYVYNNKDMSDKFNDHSLSIGAVAATGTKFIDKKPIDDFLNRNDVAKRLVAKWFDRDKYTGVCDMDLISYRGLEAAKASDIEVASLTKRHEALLMDAGTELIGSTFVLVHDVIYIDKAEENQDIAAGIHVGGAILGGVLSIIGAATDNEDLVNAGSLLYLSSETASLVVSQLEGFRVKVRTHLYQVEWDSLAPYDFYEKYYTETLDPAKIAAWEDAQYKLKYIGTQEVKSGQTVMKGVHNPEDVIKKVVYRALDECVLNLQKQYEAFRLKEPIYSMGEKKTVHVKIGLKEGVSKNSKYEVLETVIDGRGRTRYRRVGTIVPDPNRIWDNRFMAIEEGAENSELGYTTFKIKSGANSIYPGMLIREIKF